MVGAPSGRAQARAWTPAPSNRANPSSGKKRHEYVVYAHARPRLTMSSEALA